MNPLHGFRPIPHLRQDVARTGERASRPWRGSHVGSREFTGRCVGSQSRKE